MYLKTLELQGFKSFPDKTVIEFDKGMTAIVGANGSGKSNISDAVRWVLGEMSAKSLRGSKMEDVIFNGSAKRKPASFAEVVMTIDNSDYLMKIDFDEVSVGRRLYRSGESEYYLNKKQVRLKDVVDLFLNTGIGREGYSVISQGKIAEIISLKGNERRELFEEAAGISRFRYRKQEAAQKLVSVTENAVRIQDILSEVQGRLPRLEAQSAKATEYLSVAQEKRRLELAVWARRLDKISQFEKEGNVRYEEDDRALRLLTQSIEEGDRALDALYIEGQEKNVESELLRKEIAELAGRETDLTSRLSVLENEIHHLELRREEVESQGEENRSRELELEELRRKISEELANVQGQMDEIESVFEENRSRQSQLGSTYAESVRKEEAVLRTREELAARRAALSLELKEGEGFRRAGAQRRAELESRLTETGDEDESLRAKLEELSRAADLAAEERAQGEKKNGEIQLELYRIGEEISELQERLQKHRMEKMDAEQRRDTLLRMERLLEGFSDSVKEVMSASDDGVLQGICGPVSKLISTEEDYVLAVETALGGGVQNLIVEEEDHAKLAIAFLKKNRLGRATFLPLQTLRPSLYEWEHIRDEGFVGRADLLCQSEDKYRAAVEFLLGKTLICRDIESASRVARAEKYGVRIVTLDGQIVHAGGSFTGGQAQNKTGVLSRNADLQRLKEELSAAEEKIASLRDLLEEKEERRAQLRRSGEEAESNLEALRIRAGEARNALLLETERMGVHQTRSLQIREELSRLEESLKEKELREEVILRESEELVRKEEALLEESNLLRQEKEEKEKEREALILRQGEILAERTRAQLQLEQVAEKLSENEESFRLLKEGGKRKAEFLAELEQKKNEALEGIRLDTAEREELRRSIQEKQETVRALQARINAAGEESARLRGLQKEKQGEKEKRMEAFSRLASRLAAANKEKEGIYRSLQEEYELLPDSEELQSASETDVDSLGGEERLGQLRSTIRRIGPVNLESIQELQEAKERFTFLNAQYSDITKSKEELEKLISDLESTMREMFTETFEEIRYTFRQIFVELFGGGSADIELTNKEDLLNCGVEIRVQPPGKVIKNLSLLSGGEQAFVAIALYMSLLRINPSPFCIFDEIESALDEANVRRFAEYIKKHNDKTQFIVITHRRGTMEEADTLYGITMQEKGVSDFIRLDVSESEQYSTDRS